MNKIIYLFVIIALLTSTSSYGFDYSLNPKLSLSESYIDNIYHKKTNKDEDYVSIITPGLNSELRWRNASLTALCEVGYSDYLINSNNNTIRNHADVSLNWDIFQHTRLRIEDVYDKTEDISDFPVDNAGRYINTINASSDGTTAETYSGQITGNTYYINSSNIDLEHRFGERDSLTIGYIHSFLNNKNVNVLDNKSDEIHGNLVWYPEPQLGYEIRVSHTDGYYSYPENSSLTLTAQDFEQWINRVRILKDVSRTFQVNAAFNNTIMLWSGQGVNHNYRVYNPTVGFRWDMGNDEILNVNTGYFIQSIENETNQTGLSIDGNIGKTWRFKQGVLNVTGASGYGDSQLNSDNLGFNIFYEVGLNCIYNFSRSVTSTLSTSFRHSDYVNSAQDRIDKLLLSRLEFRWQLLKWLNTSFEYRYRNMNSTIDASSYDENRVMLSIILMSNNTLASGTPLHY